MLAKGARLAQVRPASTAVTEAFTTNLPIAEITSIYVANTSGAAATFRMFHSLGSADVTDESTALFWDKNVPTADTFIIRAEAMGSGIMVGNKQLDKIFVRSSVANALTFTFYGVTASAAEASASLQRAGQM